MLEEAPREHDRIGVHDDATRRAERLAVQFAQTNLYEPDGLEVEFVTASGRTAAVLTLETQDGRPVADDDLVSVRPCYRSTDSDTR